MKIPFSFTESANLQLLICLRTQLSQPSLGYFVFFLNFIEFEFTLSFDNDGCQLLKNCCPSSTFKWLQNCSGEAGEKVLARKPSLVDLTRGCLKS